MILCPYCQTQISVSPGALFAQCPNLNCNGSFELDENGQIDESSLVASNEISSSVEPSYEHVTAVAADDDDSDLPDVEEPPIEDQAQQEFSEDGRGALDKEALSANTGPAETEESENIEFNEDWNEDSAPAEDSATDPVGIQAYDKTDSSHHPQGIYYDLYLENLDTVDIKLSLFKILEQKRFGLNVEGIKKTLKGGELLLPKLNPVVASVLLTQLRELDIKISWRQTMAVMEEVTSDGETDVEGEV